MSEYPACTARQMIKKRLSVLIGALDECACVLGGSIGDRGGARSAIE